VFGGEKNSPYTEDDPALPLSEYGRSKLAGEKNVRERLERHLIVRTAWLYGPQGRNFVTTMLRLAREREEIRVVNDQRGSPTAVPDLAEALLGLAENILAGRALPWGTYHLAGSQDASWFDLARASVAGGADRRLVPRTPILAIPSSEYPTPAHRPAWSVLDGSRARTAFGLELAPWSRSLPRVLDRIAAFAKENS
jgi:dTDP-4-dehydrorhamnose reductase